jgi:sensor histidine kinase YesM
MPIAALKQRYHAFSHRVLDSLSEIERRDVQAFDRWFHRRHGWASLVLVVAVNFALAGVAAQLPWNMSFLEAAILINGVVFLLLWALLVAWFGYRKFHGKLLRYAVAVPVVAILLAFVLAGVSNLVAGRDPFDWLIDNSQLRHVAIAGLVFGFLYALFTAIIAHLRNREYAALAVKLELERRESELSRQLAESRLRMLQLQIEPHFLFNTLGSAQQLAANRAPEAARLLGDLIRFLRAATPSLHEETTTLAEDRTLINAYLAIMQLRLGSRLRFKVVIPPELESFRIPPGMLITLVENAIKHGIEPYPPGGEVCVTATCCDGCVAVTVADTGAGLCGAPGQGIGLANIRERLCLVCGEGANLSLCENEPRGFLARLELPVRAEAMQHEGSLS